MPRIQGRIHQMNWGVKGLLPSREENLLHKKILKKKIGEGENAVVN